MALTCKGCAVMATDGKYRYVCHDGPVFDAGLIYEPPQREAVS